MKKQIITSLLIVFAIGQMVAQSEFPPTLITHGQLMGETIALRDAPIVDSLTTLPENLRVIHQKYISIPPKNVANALPLYGDESVQTQPQTRSVVGLEQNFLGATVSQGQAVPPDPSGAAGPNHYVHAVNLVVKIFDKEGGLLAGPTFLGSFLGSGASNGDPIVMYDHLADRYFVSQFRISDNALIIGVSSTPDPTGTYFVYQYPLSSFPDYPHYSVWSDSYFLTANKSGQTVYSFDRKKMLAGAEDPALIGFGLPGLVRNPNTVFSPGPVNLLGDGVPEGTPGYIVYLQDDGWSSAISEDHIKVWTIDPDYITPSSSTISAPQTIATEPFDSVFFPFGSGDIQQPGTSQRIDGQGGIVSYMVNFRHFDDHNSMLINFNSDLGGNHPAIRWMELRNTGSDPFTIFQESTFDLADGEDRFMGSMGMDEDGNIALAYNVGSTNTRAEIRYTGRMDGDPLNTMTIPETTIFASNGIQTSTNRFGDYAQMTMDMDNRTFWHTAQYFGSTNFWSSRIASFRFIEDYTDDVGVYNFVGPNIFTGPYSSTEEITVSLYNFGTDSQSNFDVELYLDGNLVATETYTGTLAPDASDTFTFSQTIDVSSTSQDYEINARTILSGDEYEDNDGFTAIISQEALAVADRDFNESNLIITPQSDRNYQIRLVSNAEFNDLNINIYNMLGQVVNTSELNRSSAGYEASVNLSTATSGVYIVEITNGTTKISKRFIVK